MPHIADFHEIVEDFLEMNDEFGIQKRKIVYDFVTQKNTYQTYTNGNGIYPYISIISPLDMLFLELSFHNDRIEAIYYETAFDFNRTVLHDDEAAHFQKSLVQDTLEYRTVVLVQKLVAKIIHDLNLHKWLDKGTGPSYDAVRQKLAEIDNG